MNKMFFSCIILRFPTLLYTPHGRKLKIIVFDFLKLWELEKVQCPYFWSFGQLMAIFLFSTICLGYGHFIEFGRGRPKSQFIHHYIWIHHYNILPSSHCIHYINFELRCIIPSNIHKLPQQFNQHEDWISI